MSTAAVTCVPPSLQDVNFLNVYEIVFELPVLGSEAYLENVVPVLCRGVALLPLSFQVLILPHYWGVGGQGWGSGSAWICNNFPSWIRIRIQEGKIRGKKLKKCKELRKLVKIVIF